MNRQREKTKKLRLQKLKGKSKIWIENWGETERERERQWVGHLVYCFAAGSRNCRIDSPLIHEKEAGEMSSCLWWAPGSALFTALLMTDSGLVGLFNSMDEMKPDYMWSYNDSTHYVHKREEMAVEVCQKQSRETSLGICPHLKFNYLNIATQMTK